MKFNFYKTILYKSLQLMLFAVFSGLPRKRGPNYIEAVTDVNYFLYFL